MAQTSRHTGPRVNSTGETFKELWAELICNYHVPIFNTGVYQAHQVEGEYLLFRFGIWPGSHGKSWGYVETFETLSELVNAIARVKAPTGTKFAP